MSENEECLKAAKILIAMLPHHNEMEQYVAENGLVRVDDMAMRLDNEIYHLKLMEDFFPCCGGGSEGASLTHMLEVTRRLAGTEYACLPIAIRLKDATCGHDAIVFEKLAEYCMGLPHDETDRNVLVSDMRKVVDDMHKKGVVHMDLYLSNFMWKKAGDRAFIVRIIDFDSAHNLDQKLMPGTWARMGEIKSKFSFLGPKAKLDHNNLYTTMPSEKINEESLRVAGPSVSKKEVKSQLDGACASLMEGVFAAEGFT